MSRLAGKLSVILDKLYARDIRWGDRRGAAQRKQPRYRLRAVLLALLMILWLPAAGFAAVGAVGAQGPPDNAGNGGDPANNNGGGPPDHAGEPGPPDHAAVNNVEVGGGDGTPQSGQGGPPAHAEAWNVSASHAPDSLSVHIDIGDGDGDELNLQLTDEAVHEGREVALDAEAVEAAAGDRPPAIVGRHAETGEGWTASVTYENGSAIFEVPHFSTQDVTFSGGISFSGDKATDATTFEYDLDSLGGVSDYSIDITGVENTNQRSEAWQHAVGEGSAFDVGGNIDPNDGQVVIEGVRDQTPVSESVVDGSSISVDGNVNPTGESVTIEGSGSLSDESAVGLSDGSSIDVGGSIDPSSESLTIHGSGSLSDESRSGLSDGSSIDVGGSVDPSSESLTIHGSGSTSSESRTGLSDGSSISVSGNADPSDESVTIVGDTEITARSESKQSEWLSGPDSYQVSVGGNDDPVGPEGSGDPEFTVQSTSETITEEFGQFVSEEPYTLQETYATPSGDVERFYLDTSVENLEITVLDTDEYLGIAETGGDEFMLDTPVSGDDITIEYDRDDNWFGDGEVEVSETGPVEDVGVSTADGSVEVVSELDDGSSATASVSLPESGDFDVTGSGGSYDVLVEWSDKTHTEDPSVSVDGSTFSHSGILESGQTASGSVDISTGSATVDVSSIGSVGGVDMEWTEDHRAHDPSATVDGSTVSHTGPLGSGETATGSPGLSTGSHTLSVDSTGSIGGVDMDWTEDHRAHDPSATIDGSTVSHTGPLASGETETGTVDLTTGSHTLSVGSTGSIGGVDMDWTEDHRTHDPSVSIDGSTVSHTGPLASGETASGSVGLTTGSHTVDVVSTGDVGGVTAEWTQIDQTEDPAVDVAGKTVYHGGLLDPGETVSESLSLEAGGSYSADLAGGEHEAIVETSWTETTATQDPSISVNGAATSEVGIISEGETVSLSTDEDWIQEGTNTVEVGLPAIDGPTSKVDVQYQHSADSASKTTDVNSTAWGERYNISNTFASQQTSATATLPFAGNVVGLNELRVRENGGEWYQPVDDDVEWVDDGPRAELSLGDVAADTTVEIEAEARKIDVKSGAVDVVNPTVGGDRLGTQFEVTDNAGEEPVVIDVTETSASNPDHVHYLSSSSWDHDATMETDGSTHELVLPEANSGGTATVETLPFEVTPASGTASVGIDRVMTDDGENEQLQFTLSGSVTSTEHEIVWYDTVEGQEYVLYSDTTDIEVDSATPSSPVYLLTDGSEQTYTLIERSETATIGGGGGGIEATGFLTSIPLLDSLLAGGPVTGVFLFLFGLAGIVLIARGVSGRRSSGSSDRRLPRPSIPSVSLSSVRSISLPSRSTLTSPRQWSRPSLPGRSSGSSPQPDDGGNLAYITAIIIAGVVGLTLVLLELSTPRSLTGTMIYGFLSGGFVSILSAIGVLLAVWAINTRTESDIPLPVNAGVAVIVLIWVLETLAPGVIIDALAGGLEEVSAIIWISVIAGGGYLIYRWLQTRDSGGSGGEETRITLDLEDRN